MSDDEAYAVAVSCSSEGENHGRVAVQPEVESRRFKRLRRAQYQDSTSSEHP